MYIWFFMFLLQVYIYFTENEVASWECKDGKMCHPVDSPAWKTIYYKWPNFPNDPHNVWLEMEVDGFNPFGNLSSTHIVWSVVLVTYNIKPWLYMKMSFCLLSLLIPGPKQPWNGIDVYLEPLVNELKLTWDEAARTYDGHSRPFFNILSIAMYIWLFMILLHL